MTARRAASHVVDADRQVAAKRTIGIAREDQPAPEPKSEITGSIKTRNGRKIAGDVIERDSAARN